MSDTPSPASNFKSEAPRQTKTGVMSRVRPRAFGVGRFGVGHFSPLDPTRYNWSKESSPADAFVRTSSSSGVWTRVQAAVGVFLAVLAFSGSALADLYTTNLNLRKPDVDVEDPLTPWGDKINTNSDTLDAAIPDKRSGKTATIDAAWTFATAPVLTGFSLTFDTATLRYQTVFSPADAAKKSTFTAAGNLDLAGGLTVALTSAFLGQSTFGTIANRSTMTASGVLQLAGMTSGSVLFAGASGAVSQDNTKLFYDDVNGRLGIGVANPSHRLHVKGTGAPSGTTIAAYGISASDNVKYVLGSQAPGSDGEWCVAGQSNGCGTGSEALDTALTALGGNLFIHVYQTTKKLHLANGTGMTIRATLDNTGNFGIGTTIPISTLTVNGSASFGDLLTRSTFTAAGLLQIQGMTSGSVLFSGTSGTVSQDNAGLFFNDTTNRLGVGTSPSTTLHLKEPSGSSKIKLTVGSSDIGDITASTTFLLQSYTPDLYFDVDVNNDETGEAFIWRKNGSAEVMRIDAANTRLGIGTSSPATVLDVAGNAQFGNAATKSTFTAAGALQLATPLVVGYGGTGAITFTVGGIVLGNGSSQLSDTGVLTNGQLLIGDGTAAPTLGTLTATADETTVANGAGTITIGIADPLIVGKGGTGVATLTANGLLLGNGTSAFTALPAMGVLGMAIGQGTGVAPSTAALRGTSTEIAVTTTATGVVVGGAGKSSLSCLSTEALSATLSNGIVTAGTCFTPSGSGDASLASTQTFTGANTFKSSFTVTSGGRDIILSTATDSINPSFIILKENGSTRHIEEYLFYRDVKSSGINGGAFTSGAWRTRELNEETIDTGNNGTLSANQVTLLAGTYRCSWSAPAWDGLRHQTRLQNVTDAVTLDTGSSEFIASGSGSQTRSFGIARFTLTASKAIEVQHQIESTKTVDGFGVANTFGPQVYTLLECLREH